MPRFQTPQPAAQPAGALERAIVPGLLLASLVAYARVVECGFVYDDIPFLLDNPQVRPGLSLERVVWAFTYFGEFNWHPLAWLSHQLDFSLFGARALGHHVTALVIHATTSAILFLVLRAMTGARWRSAAVAALFALHPAHVESVAWVSERKDVLSGLFFVLTLGAYARFARQPSAGHYLLTLALFSLGLLAKTMLVTVPFLLLLLDIWPLGRTGLVPGAGARVGWGRILREKLPFLALAILGAAAAAYAQARGGALASLESLPLATRLANALVASTVYVQKLVWPTDLAVFYPHPGEHPLWRVLLAAALLSLGTAVAVRSLHHRPYLAIGWLWFLGMLVPVIGIVQLGAFAMADRYTYLPSIGFMLALCWLAGELVERRALLGRSVPLVGGAVVLACGTLTFVQVGVWRDSATLFAHALAVTRDNYVAHSNLGEALASEGRLEEAVEHFKQAIALQPDYAIAHGNLGVAALQLGQLELAVEHQLRAVALEPDNAIALSNLGNALASSGRFPEALDALTRACERRSDDAGLRLSRGLVADRLGQDEQALRDYAAAARLAPSDPRSHLLAADLQWREGRLVEARAQVESALAASSGDVDAHAFLGALLLQEGRPQEAADVLGRAREAAPGRPDVWLGLGWAASATSAHGQALSCFERVLELAPDPAWHFPGYGRQLAIQAELGRAQVLAVLGRPAEAVRQLQRLVQSDPPPLAALTQLAWLLATTDDESLRDGATALSLAERAWAASAQGDPLALDARAAALAELGRFSEAIAALERAIELAAVRGPAAAVDAMRSRLELYRQGRPYRAAVLPKAR